MDATVSSFTLVIFFTTPFVFINRKDKLFYISATAFNHKNASSIEGWGGESAIASTFDYL